MLPPSPGQAPASTRRLIPVELFATALETTVATVSTVAIALVIVFVIVFDNLLVFVTTSCFGASSSRR